MLSHLFSPFTLNGLAIRNRIFSTGHDTYLAPEGYPSDALIAYHRARARGGVGLIVVQVVGVHATSKYTSELLMGTDDAHLADFRRLTDAIHGEGAKCFVQLFHPGRELLGRPDGVVQTAYAPSHAPSERFRTIPRAMSSGLIGEIIDGYGQAARRMAEAGFDGVEIVASHGYLPSQFWNPQINQRTDDYGGDSSKRLRFARDVAAAVRKAAPGLICGLRMSGDEKDADGMDENSGLAIARALAPEFDYLNVIAGTSASAGGAAHIAPSMANANGYVAPFAAKVKQLTGRPVFVAGRINQPQDAERILAENAADMCGMTRALICDPEMPNKARAGKLDDIRACIACNQACIGHFQLGLAISCIQHPETGRELAHGVLVKTLRTRNIMVIGGGPAGLKAAAVAAQRGHHVDLYEREGQTGGQARLAQLLPTRAEFGGIVTNLTREAERHGARLHRKHEVTVDFIARKAPDAVILATGSRLHLPPLEIGDGIDVFHAADILSGRARAGARVVVYDWLADWVGAGIAEKLAREGSHVRLAVNGVVAAFNIQNYVRDEINARLFRLGVEILPYMRLAGAADHAAYFLHTAAQEPVVLEGVDTVVLAVPNHPEDGLAASVARLGIECHIIGDCLSPRTAEEAVYEGMKAGEAV